MTKAQYTVIWIGLILVAFNLIIHVSEVKGILFGTSTPSDSSSAKNNNAASSGAGAPTPTPNASPTPANVMVT